MKQLVSLLLALFLVYGGYNYITTKSSLLNNAKDFSVCLFSDKDFSKNMMTGRQFKAFIECKDTQTTLNDAIKQSNLVKKVNWDIVIKDKRYVATGAAFLTSEVGSSLNERLQNIYKDIIIEFKINGEAYRMHWPIFTAAIKINFGSYEKVLKGNSEMFLKLLRGLQQNDTHALAEEINRISDMLYR